jgi:hypothetical protein
MADADASHYPPELDTPVYRQSSTFGIDGVAPTSSRSPHANANTLTNKIISKLPYALQRHIRSRTSRNLFLLFTLILLLLTLANSSTTTIPSTYLPSFVGFTSSSNTLSSPYSSPAHSGSHMASSFHSNAWNLQGIPGDKLTLDERLQMFLDRPMLMHYEMEELNRHECPYYTFSRNSESTLPVLGI